MNDYSQIKEEAYLANMQIAKNKLAICTFGNASAADQNKDIFAIKPNGVDYENLSVEKMVVVDFNGTIVDGNLRPSSDTKTHAVLYKNWKKLGGIVHTHSTYATSWAQAQWDIPIYGTTHADHLVEDVPCILVMNDNMIEGDYELETGYQILDDFKKRGYNYLEIPMAIVACHAPFTWAETAEKAVYNSIVLEEIAKMAWITKSIKPNASKLKQTLKQKHYQRKHGDNAYYGQS